MSYDSMDHAGWVQENIDGFWRNIESGRRKLTAKQEKDAAAAKGWAGAPKALSPFQRRAMDLLGIVGNGIYNAPIGWDNVLWANTFLAVPWAFSLATYDGAGLTDLVFLAHHAAIRVDISPNMRGLMLHLHERKPTQHALRMSQRHPTLEQAFFDSMSRFDAAHPIRHPEQGLAAGRAAPRA